MDRVIKFRGKSTSKNQGHKWLYGGATGTGRDFIVDVTVDGYLGKGIFCPVIPETFGQFTGFLDVDGKEIFEDDLLKSKENDGREYVYRVTFKNGTFGIISHWAGMTEHIPLWIVTSYSKCQVIGNAFDNPELLEGGNDEIQ